MLHVLSHVPLTRSFISVRPLQNVCRCTPAASPQNTFPEDVTVTPKASAPIAAVKLVAGKANCILQACEPHWVHAWAPPAVNPLVEIEVGTRPAIDGSVVTVDPTLSRTAPVRSPQ